MLNGATVLILVGCEGELGTITGERFDEEIASTEGAEAATTFIVELGPHYSLKLRRDEFKVLSYAE